MKAIEITSFGGPEVLRSIEREHPKCHGGQVLLKVEAAGINRPDLMQRKGLYPPPAGASDIPGLEVAGVVVEASPDVSRYSPGDRVSALLTGGGYATHCIAEEALCLPIPNGLTSVEAAALPEALFTVWANLVQYGQLSAGEHCLIHGGSGGIGTMAIQLARQIGAVVYTTAGTDEKCEYCQDLGAEVTINYRTVDFVEAIKLITTDFGRTGVDVILDMVGGDYLQRNLTCLANNGRLLQIAMQNGSKTTIDLSPVLLKSLTLRGSVMRPRTVSEKAAIARQLEMIVWPWLEQGRIKVVIDSVFPLERADKAHERMEQNLHKGKIVLLT